MFLVFGGQEYYATGGAYDLLATFEDEQKARNFAASAIGKRVEWDEDVFPDDPSGSPIEWSHVFDTKAGEVIAAFGGKPLGLGRMADRITDS